MNHNLAKTQINAVSLFTGAGGMDVGFKNAGVYVVCANEMDERACDTYQKNHPSSKILRGKLEYHLSDIKALKGIDIVFGGPPCQGFSVAGKMNPDDERSKLVWTFLEAVEELKPQLFVMENVKALATLSKWELVREKLIEQSKKLGYRCEYYLLNSEDYGVPQRRERVFFIGVKDGSEDDMKTIQDNLEHLKKQAPTVREVFATLPRIGSEGNPNTCTSKITKCKNPVIRGNPYTGMMFNGTGRPLNLDKTSTTIFASIGGNRTPIVDQSLLDNPDGFDWVKTAYEKIASGHTMDSLGAVPSHLRRISIVEAAALQTFSRDYIFCGPRTSVYKQIGNAVPCLLAEAVAKASLTAIV